jgi:beta-glucosidase/6-phospho-beta-glucosidase/beta-galactosidase
MVRGVCSNHSSRRATSHSRAASAVGRAGDDVRGFFHWTGVNNYEWLHGYDVPFGLFDRERNIRPSAEILRRQALGVNEPTSMSLSDRTPRP